MESDIARMISLEGGAGLHVSDLVAPHNNVSIARLLLILKNNNISDGIASRTTHL